MSAIGLSRPRREDSVVQFSVFTPNRLGRLHELISLLGANNVHVLALTVLDSTDSAIIRIVLDDPDKARDLLRDSGFSFSENGLVVVEVSSPEELNRLIAVLLEPELNIHYLYPFIQRSHGKSILGLSLEDGDIAERALRQHQFTVLKQSDILR